MKHYGIYRAIFMSPSAIFFSKKFFIQSTTSSNNFLSEIDLGYVQLIKVTAPDGTIPIKPFNVR